MIRNVEASHHNASAAYISVGAAHATLAPYIARTTDFGKSWQRIVNGIPERTEEYAV